MKSFRFEVPEEFIAAIHRRHHGANHTPSEIIKTYKHLGELHLKYIHFTEKQKWLLDVYWEEKKIEEQFESPIFYAAHRKLKAIQNKIKQIHMLMFRCLTNFDENGGESFDPFYSISPQDIMDDFESKYIDSNERFQNE